MDQSIKEILKGGGGENSPYIDFLKKEMGGCQHFSRREVFFSHIHIHYTNIQIGRASTHPYMECGRRRLTILLLLFFERPLGKLSVGHTYGLTVFNRGDPDRLLNLQDGGSGRSNGVSATHSLF